MDRFHSLEYLKKMLTLALSPQELNWLDEKGEVLRQSLDIGDFHLVFSSVARCIERKTVEVNEELRQEAEAIHSGWYPFEWTTDRIVRVYVLGTYCPQEAQAAKDFIEDVFDTADMQEQVAIFSALSLLPHPEGNVKLASEGIRTNMTPVFDSVALGNPYPSQYFEEGPWNQLYLKAAFMGRPLYKIIGVSERANKDLSRIILDYAHERWAAGREVSPEIWRPTVNFLSQEHEEGLSKLLQHSDPLQQAAATLVLTPSEAYSPDGTLWTWEKIGMALNNPTKID